MKRGPTDVGDDDEGDPAEEDILPLRLIVIQEKQSPLVSDNVSDICPTNICCGDHGKTDNVGRERL